MCANPTTTLELEFQCKNLAKLDLMSKSDPMVIVFDVSSSNDKPKELGRTEFISNNDCPKFKKKIIFEYFFEREQNLHFLVIDIDKESSAKKSYLSEIKHELIGEVFLVGSELVRGREGITKHNLKNAKRGDKSQGELICNCRNLNKNETLSLKMRGVNLDKKDTFGKSDPYLEIFRLNSQGNKIKVAKTSVIKNTIEPIWPVIEFTVGHLVDYNADYMESDVLIECLDWNRWASPNFIGSCIVKFKKLLNVGNSLVLTNAKKAKNGKDSKSGELVIDISKIKTTWSFFDYLKAGMEISTAFAIDFTGSNGHPMDPNSLHFIGAFNPYMAAIGSVGHVLACYDSDKLFPVYGFGAILPNSLTVSHQFHVNMNTTDPHVSGVEGILNAYKNCVPYISLSGPTHFAPIINSFAEIVERTKHKHSYYVLVILTDGVITDFSQTKNAVLRASMLPLSIVIIGVGSANFDAMHELDNDDLNMLDDKTGMKIPRDIVQFVAMRDFGAECGSRLSDEVLREIPAQAVEFMTKNSIEPKIQQSVFLQSPQEL